jgi:two-component system chemotaxis response regulator CheB
LQELVAAGARDCALRPAGAREQAGYLKDLAFRIKISSTYRKHITPPRSEPEIQDLQGNVIALGASLGGTEATASVIRQLPRELPPMVVVQHMPSGFTNLYAERLDREGKLTVMEARDGDLLVPGRVLIAPGGLQLRVIRRYGELRVQCAPGEKVSGHCPSVDVLFQSVAEVCGKDAVGILLTGMGSDGALGLLAMRRRGAYTIGQDENSSVVYGMPRAAQDIGAVDLQAPLGEIPAALLSYLAKREKNR